MALYKYVYYYYYNIYNSLLLLLLYSDAAIRPTLIRAHFLAPARLKLRPYGAIQIRLLLLLLL